MEYIVAHTIKKLDVIIVLLVLFGTHALNAAEYSSPYQTMEELNLYQTMAQLNLRDQEPDRGLLYIQPGYAVSVLFTKLYSSPGMHEQESEKLAEEFANEHGLEKGQRVKNPDGGNNFVFKAPQNKKIVLKPEGTLRSSPDDSYKVTDQSVGKVSFHMLTEQQYPELFSSGGEIVDIPKALKIATALCEGMGCTLVNPEDYRGHQDYKPDQLTFFGSSKYPNRLVAECRKKK